MSETIPGTIPETIPETILDRVLRVIATTKRLPRENVRPDSTFEELGVDSLDRLNILFDLESEFDIEINDEDAKRVANIHEMVDGITLLVNAKHSSPGASAIHTAAGVETAARVEIETAVEPPTRPGPGQAGSHPSDSAEASPATIQSPLDSTTALHVEASEDQG